MKQHVARLVLVLLFGIVLLGCEPPKQTASGPPGPPPLPGSTPPSQPSSPPPPAAPSGQAPLPPETKFGVFAGGIDDLAARPNAPQPAQPTPQPADAETERVKAEKGVGIKGRSLDQHSGAVVTPAKTFFAAKERIVFEIEVPKSLQLYEATNGAAPKTHDEFMENVIKANQIKLPVLPPGHVYVYDPAAKQLMVERPKSP